MADERDNYGVESGPVGPGGVSGPGGPTTETMGLRDEETWSALAHLSVFLNLLTGFLGPVGALVIWLMYKDRSQRVAFHALQSLWYQVAWMVILVIGWTITVFLMIVLVGFLLVPVMIVASLVPFVHMAYAAYKVNQGVDYRYPWISDLVGGPRNTRI
ncbi:MAG TPA: DUF4870 domain-containing protein [Rubrobacter sp.]|nr:DUF4870 domain-containing protein [Rubrobacter sp.]